MSSTLYSIGHSNHSIAVFLALLRQHDITALADVRSHPYSHFVPHFSQDALQAALVETGIDYVFLGNEFGARSRNPACYSEGKIQYELLAQEPAFAHGIQRVMECMASHRVALMCAEKDPLECHRSILISRNLFEMGIIIEHIHADGSLESQDMLESRLLAVYNLPIGDMFKDRQYFVAEAYRLQGQRIAHLDESM